MKISFIGSGNVGQALARLFAKAGHTVTLTNRHGKNSLTEIVQSLGKNVTAGDLADAINDQDLVVLAIPFNSITSLDDHLLQGQNVIDATNYFPQRDGHLTKFIDHEIASSQFVADYFKGSKVVKAFNSFGVKDLPSLVRAKGALDRTAIPVAGDDPLKQTVMTLIDQIGFDAYDDGPLATSFAIQADGPIFGFEATAAELKVKLAD
ncbi:NADPH-dependent F420 reductase [Oenococcus sicerae]|uniref:NADPH-dependent F420 reductase n=1 Tax=Oenococcus sicerae TaxID=2203724 RepID=UPI0010BC1CB3|nr:hypothetical protein OAL24_01483 [Oenococcus sicerae]